MTQKENLWFFFFDCSAEDDVLKDLKKKKPQPSLELNTSSVSQW